MHAIPAGLTRKLISINPTHDVSELRVGQILFEQEG
jgi:hypothetical protein